MLILSKRAPMFERWLKCGACYRYLQNPGEGLDPSQICTIPQSRGALLQCWMGGEPMAVPRGAEHQHLEIFLAGGRLIIKASDLAQCAVHRIRTGQRCADRIGIELPMTMVIVRCAGAT